MKLSLIAALLLTTACGIETAPEGPQGPAGHDGAPGGSGPAGVQGTKGDPGAAAFVPAPIRRLSTLSKTVSYDGPGFPRGANYPGLSLFCEGRLVTGSCESTAPLGLDRPIVGSPKGDGWGCMAVPETPPAGESIDVTITVFVVCELE